MKPDWKDAPEWANWLAMDSDGYWCWHEFKPVLTDGDWGSDGKHATVSLQTRDAVLEERP